MKFFRLNALVLLTTGTGNSIDTYIMSSQVANTDYTNHGSYGSKPLAKVIGKGHFRPPTAP